MKTYLIFEITVTDEAAYEEYRAQARTALEEIGGGGRLLIRAGTLFPNSQTSSIEGDWMPDRFVVVEFPTRQAAEDYYFSDTYQSVLKLRQAASVSKGMLVTPESPDA